MFCLLRKNIYFCPIYQFSLKTKDNENEHEKNMDVGHGSRHDDGIVSL